MSRPRFLADNDLNDAIVLGVVRRERGVEFSRLRELDLEDHPDDEVLDYAARETWIVMLSNRVHPAVPKDDRFKRFRPMLHDAIAEALGL